MIEKIKELEALSRILSPSGEQKEKWNSRVLQYSDSFLKDIEKDKAYYHSEEKGRGIYEFDISEEPTELTRLITAVENNIDNAGINPASGGHMGYIPGGGLYPSALGDYMAAISNRYAGVFFAAPGAVRLENMLLRWMCRLMGFPENSAGNLTSGGSIANLIAIVTAREAQGLKARDFENAVIYLSEQAHHSLHKAIRIAGLSEAHLRYIPMDENLRLSATALEKAMIKDKESGLIPFFINASIGTTNTGAVDPVNSIADIAEKYGLWFHIDAAYGGFFKLVPGLKEKFKGVERADSITLDPHKSLFLPFGTGAVLVKNKEALLKVHHYLADYMQDTHTENEEISPADISPELTKHFRGMRLWLPLKLFGLKPFRAALEEKIYLARYFHQEIQKIEGFEVGPEPELSVAMFRYVPDDETRANDFNRRLLEEIRKDGRVFLSSTNINDTYWIRVAILIYRTHLDKIELLLEIIKGKLIELRSSV
ncbi:aminotransferase class V-fold PLP-dependent enzyme [Gramella jeungdoensis]|uniref:Aminotransferase class V-fold PLP-dependent enzyme n=1 Tax=Gramella jeungdoensis TaxID=708091 RepID=A0ABT0YYU7_9FLAO|nr:aminotransferase class V-fold PLP-dependent enzyme [Gramella jeungdoensis]MCM8568642.1 aminotransferase class V-fold PLP-dependent enzyme [Gramella jeungdoensis]